MLRILCVLLGGLCLATNLYAAAPPVAAFGHTPAMESVALSPSGNLVAWMNNAAAKPLIHIL
jgi:hypothetical protein